MRWSDGWIKGREMEREPYGKEGSCVTRKQHFKVKMFQDESL